MSGGDDHWLGGGFRPVRRDDLLTVELDGEAVVFDEATQAVHALNVTGTLVWQVADGTVTLDDLVAWLAESYGLASHEVRGEVLEMMHDLVAKQLLNAPPASMPADGPPTT